MLQGRNVVVVKRHSRQTLDGRTVQVKMSHGHLVGGIFIKGNVSPDYFLGHFFIMYG
jgi:hypothetical protein